MKSLKLEFYEKEINESNFIYREFFNEEDISGINNLKNQYKEFLILETECHTITFKPISSDLIKILSP